MLNELPPVIDQWYRSRENGEMFRVVAVDDFAGTVEIEDFDGVVDVLDMDAWRHLGVSLAEPPEDWAGPLDELEADDFDYTDDEMTARDWRVLRRAGYTDEEHDWS